MPGRGETAASAPTINALQRLVATAGTASRIRCIGREQKVPSHPTDPADDPPRNVCEARAAGDHLHHRPIKIGEKKAPPARSLLSRRLLWNLHVVPPQPP